MTLVAHLDERARSKRLLVCEHDLSCTAVNVLESLGVVDSYAQSEANQGVNLILPQKPSLKVSGLWACYWQLDAEVCDTVGISA